MAKKGMEDHVSPTMDYLLLDKRPSWLRSWTLQTPYLPHLDIPQDIKHLLCSPSPIMYQLPHYEDVPPKILHVGYVLCDSLDSLRHCMPDRPSTTAPLNLAVNTHDDASSGR